MTKRPNWKWALAGCFLFVLLVSTFSLMAFISYRMGKVESENRLLREQVATRLSEEISDESGLEFDMEVAENVSSSSPSNEVTKKAEEYVAETKSPSVTQQAPVIQNSTTDDIVDINPVPDSQPNQESNVNLIEIVAIKQSSFPDEYGGTYGSYEMEIKVTSDEGEIAIPQTTSNSIGTGDIGFSYSVTGGSFKGIQDSKFTSCDIKRENHCIFKGDGKTRNLIVTIFLVPSEEDSGNYGVKFETIRYYQDGQAKTLEVNRKTANINIFY